MKFKLVILMTGLGLVELYRLLKNIFRGNFCIDKPSCTASYADSYRFIRKNILIFNREILYKQVHVFLPVKYQEIIPVENYPFWMLGKE